jgi:hypothetical protein
MKIIKYFFMFCALLIIWGCGAVAYTEQHSAYIMIKTPSFRYADMGFIYKNREEVKVEIYGNGQPLMQLRLKKASICMQHFGCFSKKAFNAQVLSKDYPEDIMEKIFRGKPLFHGQHMLQKRNGFTQTIHKDDKYQIEYRVFNQQIFFRDTINKIFIKVVKQ